MLEEFITVALQAFIDAGGDVDKFELQLRRKLMVYNSAITPITNKQTTNSSIITPKFENLVDSFDIDDPIFKELENIDVNNLSDDDVMKIANKMGLVLDTEKSDSSDE